IVSKASDDLPEPLGPVKTTILPRGRLTLTFLRLCCRAPTTTRRSTVKVTDLARIPRSLPPLAPPPPRPRARSGPPVCGRLCGRRGEPGRRGDEADERRLRYGTLGPGPRDGEGRVRIVQRPVSDRRAAHSAGGAEDAMPQVRAFVSRSVSIDRCPEGAACCRGAGPACFAGFARVSTDRRNARHSRRARAWRVSLARRPARRAAPRRPARRGARGQLSAKILRGGWVGGGGVSALPPLPGGPAAPAP